MKKRSRKGWAVIVVVAILHVTVIGTLVFVQGCGTPQPMPVEPPPAPVLPPPAVPEASVPPVRATPLALPGPASPAMPAPAPAPVVEPRGMASSEYTIQTGDSLSKIAAKHGLSTRELADLNGIKDPNKIRIGQKITIPGYSGAPTVKKTPTAAVSGARKTLAGTEYEVKSGDSLLKIAIMYGVKVADIQAANGLADDRTT